MVKEVAGAIDGRTAGTKYSAVGFSNFAYTIQTSTQDLIAFYDSVDIPVTPNGYTNILRA